MNERMEVALTVREAAEYLGLTEPTIRRVIRNGQLPITKFGGTIFISRPALDEMLTGGAK